MALSEIFLHRLSRMFEPTYGRPMEVEDLEDYLVGIGWSEEDARAERQIWFVYRD